MNKKSVIMLTLDCARPDHLGCYGYKGVDTPYLNKIAEKGVIFHQAIAQAPNTWISHASIFTGTNPYIHGVRSPFSRLSKKVKTIAEILSDHGYATAGFPSHSLLGKASGFERGYDLYDINYTDFRYKSNFEGQYFYREWNEIWDKSREWVLNQKKPFFLWMHYMGIHEVKHSDVKIPEEFLKKYSPLGQYYDAKISWSDVECIKPLYSFLNEQGLLDDVIVVIFSDHGDKFILDKTESDHHYGFAKHNNYFSDDVMKISLIVNNGNIPFKKGTEVNSQIRSIDILPSILSELKVPIPRTVEGFDVLSDKSGEKTVNTLKTAYMENLTEGWIGIRTEDWKLILADVQNREEKTKRVSGLLQVVTEMTEKLFEHKENINSVSYFVFRGFLFSMKLFNDLFNIITFKKFKKKKNNVASLDLSGNILEIEKRIVENGIVSGLFDLKNDLKEMNNVASENPRVVNLLRNEIGNHLARSSGTVDLIEGDDKDEIAEKLDHLGYL